MHARVQARMSEWRTDAWRALLRKRGVRVFAIYVGLIIQGKEIRRYRFHIRTRREAPPRDAAI